MIFVTMDGEEHSLRFNDHNVIVVNEETGKIVAEMTPRDAAKAIMTHQRRAENRLIEMVENREKRPE